MSVGKAAAQAVHAALTVPNDKKWQTAIHRTVIVLEARDESHMNNIHKYLSDRGFKASPIIDEGVNEIDPHTVTAMASEVLDKDSDDVIKAFSSFKLYRDVVDIKVSFER